MPLLAKVDLIVNGTATGEMSSDFRVTRVTADLDTGVGNVAGTLKVDDDGPISAEATVTRFEPWKLTGLSPELGRVRIPLSADVSAKLSAEHALDAATIALTGGKGSIQVPEVHPPGFNLEGLSLTASIDDGMGSVRLSKLEVNLDGLVIRASGEVDRSDTATVITANARLSDLDASHIRTFWPSKLVPDVLAWISTSLTSGTIRGAEARVRLSLPAGGSGHLSLDQLAGSFGFEDLEIAFLRPMPAATGVTGTGSFTDGGFAFNVASGSVRDLSVGSAEVKIAPLSGFTRLSVDAIGVEGPVRTAMEAITGPPLKLIGPTLPQPDQFTGTAITHLVLEVPLSGGDPQPLEVSGSSRLEECWFGRLGQGLHVDRRRPGSGLRSRQPGRYRKRQSQWRADHRHLAREPDPAGRTEDGEGVCDPGRHRPCRPRCSRYQADPRLCGCGCGPDRQC